MQLKPEGERNPVTGCYLVHFYCHAAGCDALGEATGTGMVGAHRALREQGWVQNNGVMLCPVHSGARRS